MKKPQKAIQVLTRFVPLVELHDKSGNAKRVFVIDQEHVAILFPNGKFTHTGVYDIDGIVDGYSMDSVKAVYAAVRLGILSDDAASEFESWYYKTSQENTKKQKVEEAKKLLRDAGYEVVRGETMSDGMSDSVVRERRNETWPTIGKHILMTPLTIEVSETRVYTSYEVVTEGPWRFWEAGSEESLREKILDSIEQADEIRKELNRPYAGADPLRVTGPDADGLLWIHASGDGVKGAVSVRARSVAGRAFAVYTKPKDG